MGGAYPWLPLRSLSCHLDNRSRDCLGSSSLPLTLVLLGLVQLHLFLMIQLSVVILETHTVWIRLISTKDGKMETSRIRQETKTVQILLWPGRRPSFHFNHFETNYSWHILDLLLLLTHSWSPPSPLDKFLISSFSSSSAGNPGSWPPRTQRAVILFSREPRDLAARNPAGFALIFSLTWFVLLHVLLLLNFVQGSTHEMHS